MTYLPSPCSPLRPIVVLKFGSSVLRSDADLPRAVDEIFNVLRSGRRVLCVVSAIGTTTDRLWSRAKRITGLGGRTDDGPPRFPDAESTAFAQLLATGEATSTALLTLALQRAGIDARGLEAKQLALHTRGSLLNGTPIAVADGALRQALDESAVVVVPGFVGQHADGRTSLLGRGGTDFTALYLADVLDAESCVLLKDVGGVFEQDPKQIPGARRYATLHVEQASRQEAKVLQTKAARFAASRSVNFDVKGIGHGTSTRIRQEPSRLVTEQPCQAPLRVALLGLGTVGRGVYERLNAQPDVFDVVGIAVQNPEQHRNRGIPTSLLHDEAAHVAALPCDIVVELIGGLHPAYAIARRTLRAGRHFITANKALIATHGQELRALARRHNATLSYSGSVGGAVPLLETLASLPKNSIKRIEGVLNGTTNFVLDRLHTGAAFDDAVREAQLAGFAEADPRLDLDGTDVAQKLSIAAYGAWLYQLDVDAIPREALSAQRIAASVSKLGDDKRLRLVGWCEVDGLHVQAGVELRSLDAHHTLARLRGVENAVLLGLRDGSEIVLRGKGAGRWPTSQAVIGDLLALRRHRQESRLALAV